MREIKLLIKDVNYSLPVENEIVLAVFPNVIRQAYLFKGRWYNFQNLGELDSRILPEVTHWIEIPRYDEILSL